MATGGLYGNASESVGLYGNTTNFGGSYFEWFIFYQSDTQPATPTGGSWSFVTNTGTPPTGWSAVPFSAPTLPVWVSIALVNSRSDVPLVWSAPGLFSYSSGLPILSGSGTPAVGDGINSQLYVQTSTTPQTIWFKQSGTWNRLVGSTLYADLTSAQTVAGIKTFSSPIVGSVTGTSENVTGVVAIVNGGTSSTTASGARSALGVTATGQDTTYAYRANNLSDLASASTARTNLGLGSAAVLNAGAANGVATLDSGGTVPLSQIPASIQGGVSYQGAWNASTNTPTLTSSVGTKGYYYVVSTAGSTNLNGVTDWNIGDWAIFNGTIWQKIDNTDAVTSVNGYTGTVVLTQPDIAGTASLTTVQTLTNKTLTSPIINEILDANGNEILGLSPTASATDFVTVKNGIGVGVPLHVYADGPSTNIGLHLQPKGSGLITISDGTDFNKGIRFRSSGSAASAVTLLDAVATAGRVVTLPDATTTLVGRDTTDTLTNKTIAFGSNTFSGSLSIANGGTGQTTANTAFNALAPSQTGNSGKYLTTDGTNTSWGANPLGDVVGPASSTANGIALFDGTTGKLLKDSASTDGLIYGLTVGRGAGANSTNAVLGFSALSGSNTGANNVAVGFESLKVNTSGAQNIAIGRSALVGNLTGAGNQAIGVGALFTNSSGSNNTAIGSDALYTNNASNNLAVGYQAGYLNETGATNVFIGLQAGYTSNSNSVNGNTCVGAYAGYGLTTGVANTFIGSTKPGSGIASGISVTSGSSNTILGNYTGAGAPISGTGNNCIVLSDGDGNVRFVNNNSGVDSFLPGASPLYVASDTFASNLHIGNNVALMSYGVAGNRQLQLASNLYYYNGGYRYKTSYGASKLAIGTLGGWDFSGAVAGTADAVAATVSTLGTDGNGYTVYLQGGAASQTGTGITFPATQNASSNANTLDDYEEGTWEPVITGASSNPSVTYSVQNGFYCKIGRTIIAQGRIGTSAWSGGSGDLRVSLPFVANSTSGFRASGSCSYILNITNGGSAFVPQVGENTNYMVFYKYTDADQFDTEVPANANTSGTTQINFTLVYQF